MAQKYLRGAPYSLTTAYYYCNANEYLNTPCTTNVSILPSYLASGALIQRLHFSKIAPMRALILGNSAYGNDNKFAQNAHHIG
jgi:hypothetical protein